jgi:iron(III) transport system permease protein
VRTRLQRLRLNVTPQRVLAVLFLFVLGYLVVVPLGVMLQETFIVHPMERFQIPGSVPGDYTLSHWQRTFVGPNSYAFFYRPLINTLIISLGLAFLALAIGGTLAWLVVRTDLPFKGLISNAAIIPYVMPSWTLALAWITLFKNQRIGGTPGIFTALTGISTPDWFAYGLFPITITLALHYFPFGFMLIGGALRNIDAQLEESAELLGASRATIMRRVVVPLVLPAIFSTFLLTFSRGLGTFGTPGLPRRPGARVRAVDHALRQPHRAAPRHRLPGGHRHDRPGRAGAVHGPPHHRHPPQLRHDLGQGRARRPRRARPLA